MGEDGIISIIVLSLFILLPFLLDSYLHMIVIMQVFVQEQRHLCYEKIMHWLNLMHTRLYLIL